MDDFCRLKLHYGQGLPMWHLETIAGHLKAFASSRGTDQDHHLPRTSALCQARSVYHFQLPHFAKNQSLPAWQRIDGRICHAA
jgi:hypothetical protein